MLSCKLSITIRHFFYYPAYYGQLGILTLTEDASITALMHEAQHFYDDLAKGFPGMKYWFEDGVRRWKMEYKGYMEEINFLRQKGKIETANEVLKNAKDEKKFIEDYYNIEL